MWVFHSHCESNSFPGFCCGKIIRSLPSQEKNKHRCPETQPKKSMQDPETKTHLLASLASSSNKPSGMATNLQDVQFAGAPLVFKDRWMYPLPLRTPCGNRPYISLIWWVIYGLFKKKTLGVHPIVPWWCSFCAWFATKTTCKAVIFNIPYQTF